MRQFREHDRRENIGSYPVLDYPTIFLLEGGYNRFYAECPDLCIGGYVAMRDPQFVRNGELRRSYSTANGLNDPRRRPRLPRARSECGSLLAFDGDLSMPRLRRASSGNEMGLQGL